jgi:dihydroorotase
MIIEGRFVLPEGLLEGQIRIENDAIAEVGRRLGPPDAAYGEDCLIFAGMGDVHIHAREDALGSDAHKETFATAAAAAVNGGVVHVADMPNNPAAPVDDDSYAGKAARLAAAGVPIHFTLYAGIGPGTKPLTREVPYKAYMGPSVGHLFFRTLGQLDETLSAYRGRNVSFHCEDPVLLDRHAGAATHEDRRPPECELSATRFALEMTRKHGLTTKLCHYSVGEGLALIRAAKAEGLPVTAEVTPHHVFFDTTSITPESRPWMRMNPPLRSPADRAAMLEALRDGTADYLATDHAPHTVEEKLRGEGVSGQPHLDTFGPFAAWLIAEAGFTPQRVAAICCENPGRFANPFRPVGLPPFGLIAPGYAASLTVLNLRRPLTVTRQMLRTKCGWSPFEGVTFPGSVEAVWHWGKRLGPG